ncbi:MAG: hypothetical protein WCN98_05050 [Verrucomicrobiaceae bacterium]
MSIDQAEHMAPRAEGAALFLDGVIPGQLRHQMIGNQNAELTQERKSCRTLACVVLTCHKAVQHYASQRIFPLNQISCGTTVMFFQKKTPKHLTVSS